MYKISATHLKFVLIICTQFMLYHSAASHSQLMYLILDSRSGDSLEVELGEERSGGPA